MKCYLFALLSLVVCLNAYGKPATDPAAILPQPLIEQQGPYRIISHCRLGTGKVDASEMVTLTRKNGTFEGYSLYAARDFNIEGTSSYILSFEMQVEQSKLGRKGTPCEAVAYVTCGKDASGVCRWEKSRRSRNTIHRGWTKRQMQISSAKGDANKLRVQFCLEGSGYATASFRNVSLEKTTIPHKIKLEEGQGDFALDGKLSDPIWTQAVTCEPFYRLRSLQRPTVKTTAMMTVKEGKLLIGYNIEEPDYDKMSVTPFIREGAPTVVIWKDDCVETFISNNGLNISQLIVNPIGLKHWEEQAPGRALSEWHARGHHVSTSRDFDVKTARTPTGWSCEMAVPLKGFFDGYTGDGKTLFINFTRHRTVSGDENHSYMPLSAYKLPNAYLPVELPKPYWIAPRNVKKIAPVFTKSLTVLDPAIPGVPVYLKKSADKAFKIPSSYLIDCQVQSLNRQTLKEILAQICNRDASPCPITLKEGEVRQGIPLTRAQQDKLLSAEAFRLELREDGIVLIARHRDGFMRGLGTLSIMVEGARIANRPTLPVMTLVDAPRLPYRGFALNCSWNAPYNMDRNKQGIDMAFRLRLNKLFIALDGYQSPTRFPFESIKGLGSTHFTKDQWIDLFDYCRNRGIEPVVRFTCFGKVRFWHNIPNSKWMLVAPDDMNLNIADERVMDFQLAVIREILETLRPKEFHIGLDETGYYSTVNTPEAQARGWKHSDWLVECITRTRNLMADYGCTLVINGDTFDPDQTGNTIDMTGPELLKRLPKDIVFDDWKYSGDTNADGDAPSILMFKNCGFRVFGATWFNERAPIALARTAYRHGTLGVVHTLFGTWGPEPIHMGTDYGRCLTLVAYYTWSPENAYLDKVDFLPEMLWLAAKGSVDEFKLGNPKGPVAYGLYPAAGAVRHFYPEQKPVLLTAPNQKLVAGETLLQQSKLPKYFNVEAFNSECKSPSGQIMPTYKTQDGHAAALSLNGCSQDNVKLPVHEKVHELLILAATDVQPLTANAELDEGRYVFNKSLAGHVKIDYENGQTVSIPLRMRIDTTAINDVYLPRLGLKGFFGTVADRVFVNVPLFRWINPTPDEDVKTITLLPGNKPYIRLMVFGAARK